MIEKEEKEAMSNPAHFVKKTHKGEIEIEDEENEDMSTLVAHEVKKIKLVNKGVRFTPCLRNELNMKLN